jgi:ribosomal protein S18 acetylase RimI-like enzyme
MMIEPATDLALVREMLLEYAISLGVDLAFQDFGHEMETLETYYEGIWIAEPDAGCVALRRIDHVTCEMKRLYVRFAHRGRGVGRALALHAIAEARERGFRAMRLDTLPSMREAMAMYESLGFRDIEPYRFNPIAGSRFMELDL